MKLRNVFVFTLFSVLATPGFAGNHQVESDGYDVMVDLLLRPVGLAATLIGAGIFVGVSPLTALATIPEPHDAFEKLADIIVCKPANWTFFRPTGDYRYDEGCVRKVAVSSVVETPKAVLSNPKPRVQYPADTNKKLDAIFKKKMMK